MITVNGKEYKHKEDMDLHDLYKVLGYTLKSPSLLVQVNGEVIKKDRWNDYTVPDKAVIEIVNLLRGG